MADQRKPWGGCLHKKLPFGVSPEGNFKKAPTQRKETHRISLYSREDTFLAFSPEEVMIAEEASEGTRKYLARLLNSLTGRQKEIVYLRYYEDLSYQEISELLSINFQSVANHLQRAFETLRKNSPGLPH